ncbi:hypothetical protein OEZ85_008629 [Tetradesmus obliquus]|uniref:Uncharacterized protein n=1 Tax=Tetradesmus obliquus TaxID=3088 RepID=A0ABY8TJD1_TETOB|nr:hypothetical protein OEZ85_008629 [Tetradesmus obliquus]
MATARPSVLRQVENEIHKKDAETTGLIKDLQKGRSTTKQYVQQKGVGAASNNTTARKPGAMRRSGRAGGPTVNYREDSDPIEDCSSDDADAMAVDQAPAAARRQRARQQQKQPVRLGVDYTELDSEEEAEPAAPEAAGAKQQQQQRQVQPRQRRTAAVVISDDDDDDEAAAAPGESSDEVLDASEPEEQLQDSQSDSDFEERPAARKQPAAAAAAAGRGKGRKAAAAASSEEEEEDDAGASDEDEIEEAASEDSEQQQRRSKRGAAAAVAKGVRSGSGSGRRMTCGQQQQAAEVPRRSTRGAAAGAAAAVGAAAEPARPRRAAAAAAAAATAAALLTEQQPLRFGGSAAGSTEDGSDDGDDLGSAGDSDAEDEALLGSDEGSSDAADDEHDESGSEGDEEEGWEGGSSDGGSSRKRRAAAAAAAAGSRPVPRRPRRRSGSSNDDDADEQDEGDEQAGSEGAEEAEEHEGLPNLDAFRFDSSKPAGAAGRRSARSSASPPAAGSDDSPAAAAAGAGKAGSGAGRPGRASPPLSVAKAAAVREDAEADAAEVCDPALFEPQLVARLPRGAEIERVLNVRYLDDGALQALLKLKGKSFRVAVWAPSAVVEKAGKATLLRNFITKQNTEGSAQVDIDPRWYQVERVLEEYVHRKGGEREYLVKWSNLDYSDATWELEEELARDGQGRAALARFKLWCTPPTAPPRAAKRPAAALTEKGQLPVFRNGRALRDYQETSLKWMVNNFRGELRNGKWWPRNCILGDEMGLGKTAQSIAVMAWLKQYAGVTAPFMVVAPLTTLGHWQREIQTWTGMNVVLYTGSANDRRLIRETEFYYPSDRTVRKVLGPRFDVLLTSYETVLKDKAELKKLDYAALILDEAHRLKSRTSATRAALLELPVHWWLLLSGTPVQNNMRELQGLMSVLDEEAYGDLETFLERFGDDKPSLAQIRALQAALAPVLLRRMKEDVEDLPEKEEVVIWVELTQEQRRYYRALYAKQIGSLLQGVAAKNLPGMRNLAMELRKLCCHPFLCDGLEEDMTSRWEAARAAAAAEGAAGLQKEIEVLTRASGKMLLLHKLLAKLRTEGRQVLIFSQFKMMLDVLEDYLAASDYPFERIDGDTNHKDRQAAIDRFMAANDKKPSRSASPAAAEAAANGGSGAAADAASREGSVAAGADEGGPFVFLLSTRAGGQGITLTSADTVIIYDSDWNPQNDLQAMARCHRIGQEREVTVYRLVSQNTYEQQLFETASRKYGLDEAILGLGAGENPENDAARIEQLLRLGAHAIAAGAEEEAAEDKGMAAEGIDQILAGRSEKRQLGSRKGNTFSIAHFAAAGAEPEQPEAAAEAAEGEAQPADPKAFWAGLLPEAVQAHEAALAAAKEPEVLGPRRRTVVNYNEKSIARLSADDSDEEGAGGRRRKRRGPGEDGDDFAPEGGEGDGDDDLLPHKKKHRKREAAEGGLVHDPELGRAVQPWSGTNAESLARAWLRYGPDRLDKLAEGGAREHDEVRQVLRALTLLLDALAQLPKAQPVKKAAAAGAGDGAAAAAADAAKEEEAAAKAARHGALSGQAVSAIRDALSKAGVADKLPPVCRKALLSNAVMQALARNPAALKQQVEEHRKVHAAVVKAGLATQPSGSKPAAAAAGEGTPTKQAQDGAATPAAAALKSPGKRSRIVPRVPLRGFKQLPGWWTRDHDERLLLGSWKHGYSSHMRGIMDDILSDPQLGLGQQLALDPVAVLLDAHPPPPAPAPAPAAAGGEAAAAPQPPPNPYSHIPPAELALAKDTKECMLGAARARGQQLQLFSPQEWKKLVSALQARLRKVRAAMLDPSFVEEPTPIKKEGPQLNLSRTPGSAPGAATGGAPAAQQRLNLTPPGDEAAAAGGKRKAKSGKEDNKQRKLSEFFSAKK